jgi:sensor c-di-GMP phosphodiesterase-like protein
MKKNILIAVLSVMTLLSFMYAFVQKAEVEKQREFAIDSSQRAEVAYRQAMECKQMAQQLQEAMSDALAATEAQKVIAEKAVADANKK